MVPHARKKKQAPFFPDLPAMTTRPQQLPLFSLDAVALQERLEEAKGHFRALKAERDDALEALSQLKRELKEARQELTAARQEVQRAQLAALKAERQAALWQGVARNYQTLAGLAAEMPPAPARERPSRADLTRLLTLCHPDRWSAGQDAATLAHEVTVLVNQLRDRAEGAL